MAHLAQHLAAGFHHHLFRVALERVAEGIVGGEEEPGLAAGLDDRAAGAVRQHPGVVGPVDGVRRAGLAGEVRGRGARDEKRLVLVPRHLVDGERHRRGRHVDDHVDLVDVVPLPRNRRADFGLVLVIGGDDLDLHAFFRGAEVFHCHARRDHRALPREVRVEARLVVQHADLDDAIRDLRLGSAHGKSHRGSHH